MLDCLTSLAFVFEVAVLISLIRTSCVFIIDRRVNQRLLLTHFARVVLWHAPSVHLIQVELAHDTELFIRAELSRQMHIELLVTFSLVPSGLALLTIVVVQMTLLLVEGD